MEKILIPILDNELCPRFDLAPEVLIVSVTRETSAMGRISEQSIKIQNPSSEEMYRIINAEGINTIICAGIEKELYDFMNRKGIRVVDDVCGPVEPVLEAYLVRKLLSGQSYF